MEFTSGFLVAGLLMAIAGAILIYQSVKATPSEVRSKEKGVFFVGSIPIIIDGSRRWIVAAIGVAGIVLLWLATSSLNLSLGGLF